GLPREVLARPFAARGAEPAPQVSVAEEPLECRPQRLRVARLDEEPRLAVDDEVAEAADRGRDDRAGVGHRLEARDAEALTARRARHDGSACVQTLQLVVRDEPQGARHAWTQ